MKYILYLISALFLEVAFASMCTGNESVLSKDASRSVFKAVMAGEGVEQLFTQSPVKIDRNLYKALKKAAGKKQHKNLRVLLSKVCFCDYQRQTRRSGASNTVSASMAQTKLMLHGIMSLDLDIVKILLENGIQAEGLFTTSRILWNTTYYNEERLLQIAAYPNSHSFMFWNPLDTIQVLMHRPESQTCRYISVAAVACNESQRVEMGEKILQGLITCNIQKFGLDQARIRLLKFWYDQWKPKAISIQNKVNFASQILKDVNNGKFKSHQDDFLSAVDIVLNASSFVTQPVWDEDFKLNLSDLAYRIRHYAKGYPQLQARLTGLVLHCLNFLDIKKVQEELSGASPELCKLVRIMANLRTFQQAKIPTTESPLGLLVPDVVDVITKFGLELVLAMFDESEA